MNFKSKQELIKTFLKKSKRTSRNLLVSMIAATSILGAMSVSGNALTNVALQSVQARTKKTKAGKRISKKNSKKKNKKHRHNYKTYDDCIITFDKGTGTLHIKASAKGNKINGGATDFGKLDNYMVRPYFLDDIGENDVYEEDTDGINYTSDDDGEEGIMINTNVKHISIDSKLAVGKHAEYLFAGFINLQDISGLDNLDTSKVTNMSCMFYQDRSLTNLDLSSWDTNKVTNMSCMFGMFKFDVDFPDSALTSLNVSNFNTSKVTNMDGMFFGDEALTSLDLSRWNTSKVTNMKDMFLCDTALTEIKTRNGNPQKDLGKANTKKKHMFLGTYLYPSEQDYYPDAHDYYRYYKGEYDDTDD